MNADLDTLATALFVKSDDLLKSSPHLAPWRQTVGIAPQLSDAELVTLAVMQAMLGFTSEARWLRHAGAHLRHLFPYLPKQPGYNKRLRKAATAGLIQHVIRLPAVDTTLWSDDVWVVHSTPVECGRSRETVKRSDLTGRAEYGYGASHSRFFWGLRLHLVCTGLPIAFALTGAKADERETLLAMFEVEPGFLTGRTDQTLIGDKNSSAATSRASSFSGASGCYGRPARAKPSVPDPSCSTSPSRASSTSNATAAALPAG